MLPRRRNNETVSLAQVSNPAVVFGATKESAGIAFTRFTTNIVAVGNPGGPFAPSSFQYQLSAIVGSINYSISGVPNWLTPSSTSGTASTGTTVSLQDRVAHAFRAPFFRLHTKWAIIRYWKACMIVENRL